MRTGRWVIGVLALLVTAPAARADETIIAGPPVQYYTPNVTIDQGERVTFTNLDPIAHDVVSRLNGPDGQALFRSELISGGDSTPVAGAEYLTSGAYEFFCSIHANMVGTLTVTSAGQPAPRPPGSSPPPAPPPSAPSDTQAPSVTLRILDARVRRVVKRRALRVRITASEPSTVGITARAGSRRVASGTFSVTGRETVLVKLSSAGRKRLSRAKKRVRIRLGANAVDGAGNSAAASTARTLAR